MFLLQCSITFGLEAFCLGGFLLCVGYCLCPLISRSHEWLKRFTG